MLKLFMACVSSTYEVIGVVNELFTYTAAFYEKIQTADI